MKERPKEENGNEYLLSHGWTEDLRQNPPWRWRDPLNRLSYYTMEDALLIAKGRGHGDDS